MPERKPSLPDAAGRERIEASLDRNVLVEAAAGTGKTTLMVRRILNLVRQGQRLGGVAAITFTEKAAGELKMRLREHLEQAGAGRDVLEELETAQCSTIHSFCAAILHERPVEAGVDPAFQVADAMQSLLLQEDVWRTWFEAQMADARGDGGDVLTRALYLDIESSDLRGLAEALVSERSRLCWDNLPACRDTAVILGEAGPVIEQLTRLVAFCSNAETDNMARRIAPLVSLAPVWSALTPFEQEHVLLRAVQGPPAAGHFNNVGGRDNWSNESQLSEARELMTRLVALCDEAANAFLRALLFWLRDFGHAYEQEKRRRGLLDFDDLLIKTRDLLRDNREVRGLFQRRFERLLVDEFQDTDPLQVEIVFFLAEAKPRTARWEDVKLAPGKLFVVGDPKQSIYRFRGADIEIYHRAKQTLAAQGDVAGISTSFRTASPLVGWVNEVFERLIQPPAAGAAYQPGYVPLVAHPELKSDTPRVLLLEPTEEEKAALGDRPPVGALRRVESRAVAQVLLHLHGEEGRAVSFRDEKGELRHRKPLWSDFAVLLRGSTALDLYERVFEAHGIPFLVEGGKDYFERPEVRAVCALLLALDNPADTLELVSVLRSPLFGVSDDDLLLWTRRDNRPLDYLAATGGDGVIGVAFGLLRELHAERNRCSYAAFLERCYERLKIPERFLLHPQGEQRVANLYKLVDTVRAVQSVEGMSLRGLARHLRDIAIERVEEGQSPTAELKKGEEGAVTLLSIHKAKGLEWGVVVLADMAAGRHPGREMLLPAPQTRRPEARLSGLRTAGFDAAREAEQLREDAEARRLLYVACTRARDWFVLPWMDRRGAYTRILAEAFDPHKAAGVERVDRTKLTQPPSAARPVRVQLGQPEGRDREQVEKLIATRAAWQAARERQWPSLTAGVVKLTPHKLGEREHFRGEAGGVAAGGGIEIGRGVHEALARCDLRDVEAAVKLFPAGEKLIRAALTHELMKRVLAADEFHREMPVVWQSPDGLLEGYIDLLFREGDGLVIVDYKTDAKPDARLYQGQLAAYAAAVEAITGRRVVEKMLFFLSAGSVERV